MTRATQTFILILKHHFAFNYVWIFGLRLEKRFCNSHAIFVQFSQNVLLPAVDPNWKTLYRVILTKRPLPLALTIITQKQKIFIVRLPLLRKCQTLDLNQLHHHLKI